MRLIAFELTVPAAAEESATVLLWEHGTTGVEVKPSPAGQSVLLAYFTPRDGLEQSLRREAATLGARLVSCPVPHLDWVARYREGFRPFTAGGFLIVPCWDVPARADRPVLLVDPGRAFGTGTHESTRLCLDALAELRRAGLPLDVLDVGTGSGILAVAARLGAARRVTAVDIDAEALSSARRHAALNGVELRLVHGDGARPFRAAQFDLVLANLSASLLHERRDELVAARAPGGTLVLSGFLADEAASLQRAYGTAGGVDRRRDGDWAALVVRSDRTVR